MHLKDIVFVRIERSGPNLAWNGQNEAQDDYREVRWQNEERVLSETLQVGSVASCWIGKIPFGNPKNTDGGVFSNDW